MKDGRREGCAVHAFQRLISNQDLTLPFPMDDEQNIYFPQHVKEHNETLAPSGMGIDAGARRGSWALRVKPS